jgi:vacuolar-type H+-ATPase subunit E/Vma4
MEELLRVLREEAANEERGLREGAEREAARIVAEARAEAARLRAAALAREAAAEATRSRALQDSSGLERERALLAEARRQLDALRGEALLRLPEAVTGADVERFATELMVEAGPVDAILVVDPGMRPSAARAVEAIGRRPAPEIREAGAPRGGVELLSGALILDDTLPSRLERAWPRVEPEIARLLLGEG